MPLRHICWFAIRFVIAVVDIFCFSLMPPPRHAMPLYADATTLLSYYLFFMIRRHPHY